MQSLKDFLKYDAVYFDLDGTLVDTKDLHFDSLKQSLKENGIELPLGRLDYPELEGLPTRVKLEILAKKNPQIKQSYNVILDRKQFLMEQLISDRISEDKVVTKFLQSLKGKVKLGLCSNARDITVTKILDLMKITDYFDIILSADDVQKPKPDPEIYLTACSKLSVIPQNCLIVEDSDVGVTAGKATGANLFIVTGPDNFKPFID